ncbi:MAG: bifunctional folylpolyglutamate synthase/dihydrofolate synthase [Mojavia pulchra JT2-VF2]|uniref:tetrahydrofolate synthase n=1 Tax=Mojavia pulchra JT2-VF2 TaxID=287848 RepID=A0A951UG77_9NOST|nr:bifunctional folylpolyglutamate synthase/dihydrofolate synthase [Mojavia pulchra JT2-VF2]
MDIDSLLKTFQPFGINLGLSRIVKLLANLGNPHDQVPVIHVAGTNGKGSVCAYLSSVLTEAGYRTGRYISPHLVDWTERICINEQAIASEELYRLLLQVQAAIARSAAPRAIAPDDECPTQFAPTQFEFITAAAWLYFAQQQVDVAVVEVGLGGRLDATNVCPKPLVTIITSISREHWQQLGPTIADIAREKAGILKPGCPAIVGPLPKEALEVVRSRIQELQCPMFTPHPARQISSGWAEYQTLENSKLIQYPLPLQGQIQLTNSALALAAVETLQKQGWYISQADIINGMAKTNWPGRIQWITWKKHQLLLDGAHNPAGAKVLREYVDTLDTPRVTWVMGMMANKDHADIFKALLRSGDNLLLVPIPDTNSAVPNELAKLAIDICPELSFCQSYPDLYLGLEAAFASTNNVVVLCGSLYLIGYLLGNSER